jgi:hypothetical protein
MVIGERFAWGHLPKTGGDAALALFRLFPRLLVRADDSTVNAKHDLFSAHEEEVRGKLLVMNIRRLPSWILSWAQHRARRGIFPKYKPLPMWSPAEMADSSEADARLNLYLANGRFEVDRWLRTEYLRSDFLEFISELTPISEDERRQILELQLVNALRYEHDVRRWFTDEQLERMYKNNPLWTSIEERAFGGRFLDAPPALHMPLPRPRPSHAAALAGNRAGRAVAAQQARPAAMQPEPDGGRRRAGALRPVGGKESVLLDELVRRVDGMERRLETLLGHEYRRMVRRIRRTVGASLPPAATVIVVSKGDDQLLQLGARRAWHFPRTPEGWYLGRHPSDSAETIAHLDALRGQGAEYLLLPATAFWWLDHYSDFRLYLEGTCRQIRGDEHCVIYQLIDRGAVCEGA